MTPTKWTIGGKEWQKLSWKEKVKKQDTIEIIDLEKTFWKKTEKNSLIGIIKWEALWGGGVTLLQN